jgi:hypothetical protein
MGRQTRKELSSNSRESYPRRTDDHSSVSPDRQEAAQYFSVKNCHSIQCSLQALLGILVARPRSERLQAAVDVAHWHVSTLCSVPPRSTRLFTCCTRVSLLCSNVPLALLDERSMPMALAKLSPQIVMLRDLLVQHVEHFVPQPTLHAIPGTAAMIFSSVRAERKCLPKSVADSTHD